MIKNVFALYNVQKHNPALKQQKGQKKEHKENIFVLKITTYNQ